jgi:hypothetical protein
MGHQYAVGRDARGNLYPAYRVPNTDRYVPLYYDGRRDRYYMVAEEPYEHRYARHYIDDPDYERYYYDPDDYSNYNPVDYDRPVIYTPAGVQTASNGHGNDWLWAIPVIIAAAVLLQPHHHNNVAQSPPPRVSIIRPMSPVTVVNRNVNNVHVVNRPMIVQPTPRPVVTRRAIAAKPVSKPAPAVKTAQAAKPMPRRMYLHRAAPHPTHVAAIAPRRSVTLRPAKPMHKSTPAPKRSANRVRKVNVTPLYNRAHPRPHGIVKKVAAGAVPVRHGHAKPVGRRPSVHAVKRAASHIARLHSKPVVRRARAVPRAPKKAAAPHHAAAVRHSPAPARHASAAKPASHGTGQGKKR